jgi:hypothetical protein
MGILVFTCPVTKLNVQHVANTAGDESASAFRRPWISWIAMPQKALTVIPTGRPVPYGYQQMMHSFPFVRH